MRCLAAASLFAWIAMDVTAQAVSPATIVGVSVYDRTSNGAGAAANLNRVRFVDGNGASVGTRYPAGSYPADAQKSWSYAIALDAHPDPDPNFAALGVTFVRYVYVADPANHRIRRFRLEKKTAAPTYNMAGSPTVSQYLVEWGSYGTSLGTTAAATRLAYPTGIAVHPVTHDVYVADTMNSRILVFEFQTNPNLATPREIEVEGAVLSGGSYLVQQINPVGSHVLGALGDFRDPPHPDPNILGTASVLTDDGGAGVGVAELGQGRLYYPHGLAIDVDPGADANDPSDDTTYLFIADTWNHRIQVFKDEDPGYATMRFRFHRVVGGYGTTPGRFRYPRGIATHRGITGTRIFVADTRNTRVQILDMDFTGNIAVNGTFGSSADLVHPVDVSTDASGNVYVADPRNDTISGTRSSRIRKYDNSGTFLSNIGGTALVNNSYTPYGIDVVSVLQY
jgi:DNA-binding beta-propeller fold protein YncE